MRKSLLDSTALATAVSAENPPLVVVRQSHNGECPVSVVDVQRDPRLAQLTVLWPLLSEGTRQAILKLAEPDSRAKDESPASTVAGQ